MFKFWYDATMLSIEAQHVIGLRMMKLAMGGKHAQAEASRMVTEKIAESMARCRNADERRFRSRRCGASPPAGAVELPPPVALEIQVRTQNRL